MKSIIFTRLADDGETLIHTAYHGALQFTSSDRTECELWLQDAESWASIGVSLTTILV